MTGNGVKVARGVATLYLANITTLVLNTLFLVLLTNYYVAHEPSTAMANETVGLIAFLNVVLVAASTLSVLALPVVGSGVVATPPAVTRFLTLGGRDAPSPRKVYYVSVLICAVISATIVLLASYPRIAGSVAGPDASGAVFAACADALVYSFAQLGAYTMLGTDRATFGGTLIIASSAVRYMMASVFVLAGSGPSGVFLGFLLGDSVLAVAANAVSFRSFDREPAMPGSMSPVFKYMVSVFLAALMGLAVSQADKVLTFFQLGLGDLAVYNIATVGAAVVSFAPASATNILVPALSSLASDETARLSMLRTYTRHMSLTAIPIGFILAAISPFLLLVFGSPYAEGAPVLSVIAISISLTSIASVYSSSLLVDDRAHHFALSNLAGLVGLVVVAVLTVPWLGFFGIALGRAVMLFIMFGAVAYFVKRQNRLVVDAPAYLKSLGASALMAVFVYAVLDAARSLGPDRLALVVGAGVMVPVGFGCYLLIMKSLRAYTMEDMDFLDSLLPRFMRRLSRLGRKLL